MKKVFYHVAKANTKKVQMFTPRIPADIAMTGEENSTPRVCIAPTIKDCLGAVPFGGDDLIEKAMITRDLSEPILIYEFEIDENDENLVPPETLFINDWVRDAIYTNEHWYTKELIPTKTYYIAITGFDLTSAPCIMYEDLAKYKCGSDVEHILTIMDEMYNLDEIEKDIDNCYYFFDDVDFKHLEDKDVVVSFGFNVCVESNVNPKLIEIELKRLGEVHGNANECQLYYTYNKKIVSITYIYNEDKAINYTLLKEEIEDIINSYNEKERKLV